MILFFGSEFHAISLFNDNLSLSCIKNHRNKYKNEKIINKAQSDNQDKLILQYL